MKTIVRLFILVKILKEKYYNQNATIRANDLLDKVNEKLSLQDIAPIGERTLDRDIKALKKAPFNFDIKTFKKSGYYLDDTESKYDFKSPLYFFEPYILLHNIYLLTGLEHIMYPEPNTDKGLEWLYTIAKQIKNKGVLKIRYSKHGQNQQERTVFPIVLKQFRGIWYVVAKDKKANDLRTFGLDRIDDIALQSGKLSANEFKTLQAAISSKFKDSYGIYSDENNAVEKVVLKFDDTDLAYLTANPLHSSQSYSEKNNTLTFQLRITEDFKMALMSRIWSLDVVEPKWLRKEIKQHIDLAAKRNS